MLINIMDVIDLLLWLTCFTSLQQILQLSWYVNKHNGRDRLVALTDKSITNNQSSFTTCWLELQLKHAGKQNTEQGVCSKNSGMETKNYYNNKLRILLRCCFNQPNMLAVKWIISMLTDIWIYFISHQYGYSSNHSINQSINQSIN